MKKIDLITSSFLLILVVFSLQFCNSERSLPVVDVVAKIENLQEIPLSDFVENIRYVPLDMKILYGNASPVVSGKYILTFDGTTCYLHDINGKFIRKIGTHGRGPGEYMNGGDHVFLGDKIFIYSDYKLLEYSLDGTLIKNYKDPYKIKGTENRLTSPIIINDSTIFGGVDNWNGKEKYKALMINLDGEITHSYKNYEFFNLKPGIRFTNERDPDITVSNGVIYFKEFYNDTLFQLDGNQELIPKLVFNLGKYKVPISHRGSELLNVKVDPSYMYISDVMHISKNKMIFSLILNDRFYPKRLTPKTMNLPGGQAMTWSYYYNGIIGVFDFNGNNLFFIKPTIINKDTDNEIVYTGLYNDIDAGPRINLITPDSIACVQLRFDFLVNYIKSDYFKNYVPKFPERKERLKILVDSLIKADFSNPVLMIMNLKN